jgi:hypothetical protein
MLPLPTNPSGNSIDLNPWLLLRHDDSGETEIAMWNVVGKGDALIVFSTASKAEDYLRELGTKGKDRAASLMERELPRATEHWEVLQPDEIKMGHILIPYYRHGIRWLVLDPTATEAKLIYSLTEVLKGLQSRLVERSRGR